MARKKSAKFRSPPKKSPKDGALSVEVPDVVSGLPSDMGQVTKSSKRIKSVRRDEMTPITLLEHVLSLESPALNTRKRRSDKGQQLTEIRKLAKREVEAASQWWAMALQIKGVTPEKIKGFRDVFERDLYWRCAGHWYPEDPQKASGYRSVICDIHIDKILQSATEHIGISADLLPKQVVQIIGPGEVKLRHCLHWGSEELIFACTPIMAPNHV